MTQELHQLQDKINRVRRRLQWIVFAKGLALTLAFSLAIVVAAILLVDHWNYADWLVSLARIFSCVGILALLGWFLARPLVHRVEDARIARCIEERYPQLEDRLVSAVELGRQQVSASSNPILSLLIRDALSRSKNIQPGTLFNPKEPFLSGTIAFGLVCFFILLQLFGPNFFQYATLKIYANWLSPQAVSFYRIDVSPGNAQVRKGSDQLVSAQLIGFDTDEVFLYSRHESGLTWERNRMDSRKGSNAFGFLFLDINERIHYYTQAGNVKSPEFTLAVTDVARVEKISLTYQFPRYTGLPDRIEEDGGEISAVKGTHVALVAETNAAAASARILLEDGTSLPMEKITEKSFRGQIEVEKDSAYKVELTDFSKHAAVGSHEYPITALDDQPPLISILKPGRDKKVTKLEEVLAEVKADDDFGVNSLEFHYTVNGGKENVVDLFRQKTGTAPKSISGTHTFFLEEFNLEPGDVISYFARASDAGNTSTSDIYFLEIRTFGKEYSQAQTAGGMGGGAADAGSVLSARQKEILAATWRLIRDQKSFGKSEYSENLKLVASLQQKLQQQTKTLSDRIQRRALTSRDKEIQKLSENLLKSIEAMTPAHQMLSQEKPKEAVSPEQTALQHLMRAEAYFKEIQVAYGNNGGGQGSSIGAQELENLFELELDKLKNQYETQQQRNSMQTGAELDEALRKLKELAERQQQLNERKRQMRGGPGSSQRGGSGSEQEWLQQEAERLARQLEKLSRENQDEDLLRASQQLKQAAQDMRNSQSGSPSGSSQNRGLQALSRLNDARQLLDSHEKNGLSNDLKRLQQGADELVQRQETIQQALENLSKPSPSSSFANPSEQMEKEFIQKRQILQNKAELNRALDAMEQNLFGAARKAATQQKTTSQKLQAAGNAIRDNHLQDKVTQGGQLIARGMLDIAQQREQSIGAAIGNLKERIASTGKRLDTSSKGNIEERLSRALNQTGDLVANLESFKRRAQEMRVGAERKGNSDTGPKNGSRSENGEESGEPDSSSISESGANAQEQALSRNQRQDAKAAGQHPSQDRTGHQKGQQSGRGGESNGQGSNDPSRRAQAHANSESSVQGGNSARGETKQDFFNEGEHQFFGSTNHGTGAVNFGDRDLTPPLGMTPDQVRQFEKEFDLRMKEAQEIGKSLADHPDLAGQLKNMQERMKQMKSLKLLYDERGLERLETGVIQGFRQLELNLSKNLQHTISKQSLHLAKDEEVPEAYRKQVEEYYKALAKR